MSAPDSSVNHNAASKKCQKDTGGWLLTNPAYLDWKDRPDSFLWLQGFAGCGKTILCSTVINDMTRYIASRLQNALAFYYFDFANDVKTKTLSCLRSIILQLAEQTADTKSLEALRRAYAMGTPPIQEFLEVLRSMICTHGRVYIVLDALDECTDQEELFDLLNSVRDWKLECLSILATSRDEPDIRECVHPAPEQEIRLRNSAIDNDVRLFILETLRKDKKLQVWSELFPDIEKALTEGAHGMFRWVDCQLQTLRECPSRAEVRKALRTLPETLDKTYERILGNIRPNLRDYALRLLEWLCIADGPVDMKHIMEAFGTSIGDQPRFEPDARFVSSDKVLALCPGLVTTRYRMLLTKRPQCVQIAHYSVKEYLISNRVPIAPNPLCMFRVQKPLANLAMAKTCLVYAIFAPLKPDKPSLEFPHRFMQSARREWPNFFEKAKRDSQLMELAISYLTRKQGYTLSGGINKALDFAFENRLHDIETRLIDHHGPSIDPNLALLAKCEVGEIQPLDFVDFWIERGADVNAIYDPNDFIRYVEFPSRGSTPLHIAAFRGSVALAQHLLQHGAILKAEDFEGSTPLEIAFRKHLRPTLDLIKQLWFDAGQNCFDSSGSNFLHQVARNTSQQRDKKDSLGNSKVQETVAWLIDHGVDPLRKNAQGETPLHNAARTDNLIAIKALYAATGRSSEYGGCLLAFLENVWLGERMLSTAQLLLEIDPDPFGKFEHSSGLLPFLLSTVARAAIKGDSSTFGSKLTTPILKHREDPALTRLDMYMSFLEFMLSNCRTNVSTIMRWLATELVKRRDPEFLGVGVWSAAIIALSYSMNHEIGFGKCERVIKDKFRQIQELFERRVDFGVGIKELYRLLLWTTLDGGPLAKLIISQELRYAALALSDETQRLRWLHPDGWHETSIVSLMVHREIHPDTKSDNDDAELLDAISHDQPNMTTRLLMQRLLKRACDINQQTREGLTILAGGVTYLSRAGGVTYLSNWTFDMHENEVLKSCLDGGCDADIQDNAGRTPLMIAAYRGVGSFAELLLNAGCNANLQDREGGTPVTNIVTNGPNSLWKQRFSPVGGHTALMYAVIVGKFHMVKALLKHGCDTKLRNNQGRTALDLARQFDEREIIDILAGHEKSVQSER